MNADRLLAHYEKIMEAPAAVASLRRFILDLAIRGKLVVQDATEEPASGLLLRIEKEKLRRIATGETKAAKATLAQVEAPFKIPATWAWSQLADIGVVSPQNKASDTQKASFVPMTLIAAEYGIAHRHEIRSWGQIKKGYTHFAEGDVGLAKITPCFENGKSTVFRNLTGGIGSGTTELHIIRPILVEAEYVLLYLKTPYFVDGGIPRMTGTAGQKRVSSEYFSQAPFPLPPLAEQRRIVAKVAEVMELCDQLEGARLQMESGRDRLTASSLDRLSIPNPGTFQKDVKFVLNTLPTFTARPDQIKRLRQAIVDLAINGRLVPQNPADGTAALILEQLAVEREGLGRKRTIRNELIRLPTEMAHFPFPIPPTWAWSRLGAAVLFIEYGTSSKGNAGADGVPVLTMGNIQDGAVLLGKAKTIPSTSPELPNLFLRTNDLLYNRTNSAELVGKTGIYEGDNDSRTFASYLIRIRCSANHVDPKYLNLVMNAPEFRRTQIIPLIKKQTGQANVNGTSLRNMLVPVPPWAEQRRIVIRTAELMALCDQLSSRLDDAAAIRLRLRDALLAEALAPAE